MPVTEYLVEIIAIRKIDFFFINDYGLCHVFAENLVYSPNAYDLAASEGIGIFIYLLFQKKGLGLLLL